MKNHRVSSNREKTQPVPVKPSPSILSCARAKTTKHWKMHKRQNCGRFVCAQRVTLVLAHWWRIFHLNLLMPHHNSSDDYNRSLLGNVTVLLGEFRCDGFCFSCRVYFRPSGRHTARQRQSFFFFARQPTAQIEEVRWTLNKSEHIRNKCHLLSHATSTTSSFVSDRLFALSLMRFII